MVLGDSSNSPGTRYRTHLKTGVSGWTLIRQLKDNSIKILPILIENCDRPPLLEDIKYADFRNDYNRGFSSLIEAFQEKFDLEPYVKLVESTLDQASSWPYNTKTFAILLKRLNPLPYGSTDFINTLLVEGEIVCSNEDDFYCGMVDYCLRTMVHEKLVKKDTEGDRDIFTFTELGRIVVILLSEGQRKGIIKRNQLDFFGTPLQLFFPKKGYYV
jgi:hypothetical protein